MKKVVMALVLGSLSGGAFAEGHYVPGIEGIRAASAPPPGTYYIGYLVHYDIDSLKVPGTDDDMPGKNGGSVTALANRFVHMTDNKFLGADYGIEAVIPIINKDLNLNAIGYRNEETGVGDIYLAPLILGWHDERWDGLFSAGIWFDTANSGELADPGNGYPSTMLTGGGTVYLDQDKSFSASAMMRYEFHMGDSQNPAGSYDPGDQATMEWGIGKKVTPVLELGFVGYSQWQTTKDSGAGASADKFSRHAIGVEASYLSKMLGGFIEVAYYNEYDVEAGTNPAPKGDTFRLNIVKPF